MYVGFGQGSCAVPDCCLHRGPGATNVSDRTRRGNGYTPRTASTRAPSGAGSRSPVRSVRISPSSRPTHVHSLSLPVTFDALVSCIARNHVSDVQIAGNPAPHSPTPRESGRASGNGNPSGLRTFSVPKGLAPGTEPHFRKLPGCGSMPVT